MKTLHETIESKLKEISVLNKKIQLRKGIILMLEGNHAHQEDFNITISIGGVNQSVNVTNWTRSYQHQLNANYITMITGMKSGLQKEIKDIKVEICKINLDLSQIYETLKLNALKDSAAVNHE
jgi:hypothetical protein